MLFGFKTAAGASIYLSFFTMSVNTERIERYKASLFEHLHGALERSIYELYTLCEYDSNLGETSAAATLLHTAFQDFSEVGFPSTAF